MVILASEDVGLADPQALVVAIACQQAVHFIGMPEGFYAMAETALYLALAPKSNTVGAAYGARSGTSKRRATSRCRCICATHRPPDEEGLRQGYKYAHDFEGHVAPDETYLPESTPGPEVLRPDGSRRRGEAEDAPRRAQAKRATNRPASNRRYIGIATSV